MNRIAARCRDSVRRKQTRSLRPTLEGLEDRKLLATLTGGFWSKPIRVSYSFVPDGTLVDGVPSNLFATLNAVDPNWQVQFQKAAAIWQQVAGINLALVPENPGTDPTTGQPLPSPPIGSAGNQQNDPRFGDIRIGGTTLPMSWLATATLPPPINGGTAAGDIVFNTAQSWQVNNDYDLLTVALHEFGHSLGLGHSLATSQNPVMQTYYNGVKQSLKADDISGIDSIYGPVPADPTSNGTWTTAIGLNPLMDSQGRVSYNGGYMVNAQTAEWYSVAVPTLSGGQTPTSMTVTMQSTGLSSLSPRVAVFNNSMAVLGQAYAINQYGATVTFTVNSGLVVGNRFYFRATAAQNANAGSNGAFALLINFGTDPLPPALPYGNITVASQPDQGGGNLNESTSLAMRRVQRRMQLRARRMSRLAGAHGHELSHVHDTPHVVTLNNGNQVYTDALMINPRRHPQPSRFRRG